MKNRKYVMMGGYAFAEDSDMEKLQKLAKEGWIIDGVTLPLLSYRFKKGEPQNLDFALDYQTEVDEEYFSLFKSAGWKHELTLGDEVHLFSAPEGTRPIYSDKISEIDKLETMKNKFKIPSIYSIILFAVMMIVNILVPSKGVVHYIATIITIWALIFTGMPYIGYQYRLRKLKRHTMN